MIRHWKSATIAPCARHCRLLSLLLLLGVGGCSDVFESPPPSPSPDTTSEASHDLSVGASSSLLTGASGGPRFDVWICGDEGGTNLGYTFSSVNVNSMVGGVGQEALLADRRSRAFRWIMSGENQLQIQFNDNDNVLEWQNLIHDKRGRLTLNSSERGPLRCLRQSVETTAQMNQFQVNSAGMSSASRLLSELPGPLSGNQASGLSMVNGGDLSLWVCQSPLGPLAQVYFVPESNVVQGQFIEATGINAVRRGRWMTTAEDAVRLDLAVQGEVNLSEVRLDERRRFLATSDRDGSLSCELETLSLSAPQDPS